MYSEDSKKVNEDTEDLLKAFYNKPLSQFPFSTNGQTLMVPYKNKLYLFDMATGVRHKEVLEIPSFGRGIGYDYKNNEFWAWDRYEDEPILRSFKIKGFQKNPFHEKRDRYSSNSYANTPTKNIFRLQKVERKIGSKPDENFMRNLEPSSAENFMKNLELIFPAEPVDVNYPENDSEEYSLYLLMFILNKG